MCKEKLDARHMSVINLTKIQIYKIAQCSVSSNKYQIELIIIFLDVRKKKLSNEFNQSDDKWLFSK